MPGSSRSPGLRSFSKPSEGVRAPSTTEGGDAKPRALGTGNSRIARSSSRAITLLIAVSFVLAACGSSSGSSPPRTASQCAKMGAKTGWAGAKTGVKTGVEGVKAAGKAVGGFVEGGSDEARKEWQQGKEETRRAAHSGAADVKQEADSNDCP